MGETGAASRPVGPVHRAFGLLQLVVAADGPVGVRDLARRSGLSKSTVGRTLGILTELGMVERTPEGASVPGAGLTALAVTAARSSLVQRERLRPLASEMMHQFGENAAVGVDDDDNGLLYLFSARNEAAVQVPDPAGQWFDFHLVAPGLMMMATWPETRLDDYLGEPLGAATTHSVTAPSAIRDRLSSIRQQGFAWAEQELDIDVNGLAAPILSEAKKPMAVATLYGPTYRLNSRQSPSLGHEFAAFVSERAAVHLGQ